MFTQLKELITRTFGTKHDRDIKRLEPMVDIVNVWADQYQSINDIDFPGRSREFRSRWE